MDIICIWAMVHGDVWLVEAWDSESAIDLNPEGFEEAVGKAKGQYGDVRLQRVSLPAASVHQLFEIPEVEGTV